MQKMDPLTLILTATLVGALAGVAALLRSTTALTWRVVVSAALNSGALGAVIACLLFTQFKDNTWFLLGLSMLAGLGGMTLLGFVIQILKKGGVYIDVKFEQAKKEPNDDHAA